MGCGQVDDTLFLVEDIQPHSFDTTDLIQTMLDDIDFVLHIGDISYARGFSAVVSRTPAMSVSLGHSVCYSVFSNSQCTTVLDCCLSTVCSGTSSWTRLSPLLCVSPTWSALGTMRGTGSTLSKF